MSDLFRKELEHDNKGPLGKCRNPVCPQTGISPMVWTGRQYSPDLQAYIDLFCCRACRVRGL